MNLSVRDVKRLLTAGIKAEYERTHDPRLEDADAMCAASLTEICRQAAAPAWNAGTKYVLDHPEIVMLYDPADASTNPWKKASEMPDDSHVESYFVVEGAGKQQPYHPGIRHIRGSLQFDQVSGSRTV